MPCLSSSRPGGADARTRAQSLALGGLIGAAFLVRPQDALFAVWPAVVALTMQERGWTARLRDALWLALWAGLGAVPALLLQVVHSQFVFSQYDYALLGQGGYLHPLDSRWLDTLFSSWHGFLSWSPVAYVAVIGSVVLLWRDTRWAATTLAVLFFMAWVNGATQDWHGNGSFGGRRFSSMLVLLAPGLALAIDMALRRPLFLLAPVAAAGVWWNVLLMEQFATHMIPREERVSFSALMRQQADLHTRPPTATCLRSRRISGLPGARACRPPNTICWGPSHWSGRSRRRFRAKPSGSC